MSQLSQNVRRHRVRTSAREGQFAGTETRALRPASVGVSLPVDLREVRGVLTPTHVLVVPGHRLGVARGVDGPNQPSVRAEQGPRAIAHRPGETEGPPPLILGVVPELVNHGSDSRAKHCPRSVDGRRPWRGVSSHRCHHATHGPVNDDRIGRTPRSLRPPP